MNEADKQSEPSMEEILASIRKIISDDSQEEGSESGDAELVAPEEPEPVEPEQPEPVAPAEPESGDEDDDVLELTQMVDEDGTVSDVDAAQAAVEETPAEPEVEPTAAAETGAVEEEPAEIPEPDADSEGLIAPETAAAASSSIAELAGSLARQRSANVTVGGGQTLDALVRLALEPYLKAWLDEYLAELVERVVREEIQKMVNRAEEPE